MLLTRDNFREGVFERDNHKCVVCGDPSQDAHHIIERRLFSDGGYYLDNGASLCGNCHIKAEETTISAQELRDLIGIKNVVLPEHLYRDYQYDKWGNIINEDGTRTKGELFEDLSVQKILPQEVKQKFINYIKYPRTYHVPWSGSKTNDDRTHTDMSFLEGRQVVVTEKRDGENSTVYYDGYFHARSIDGNNHPSQNWLKSHMQYWCYELPQGWRVCGENLYATHSIKYDKLDSYFQVFSIWNERNECLSWKETKEWCELLGLKMVPVLYEGIYDEKLIKNLKLDETVQEGYVIRVSDSFHYSQFKTSVGKYVRENHVQDTVHNWRMNWNPNKINGMEK